MLSVEECMELLDIETLCFEKHMTLDCNMNSLAIPSLGITLTLNEAQKRLLVCLFKKINSKREIINIVWYENHQRISDNNYHQLTFQLRALFQRHGLPANLLVTIPYYGLKLNETLWRSVINESSAPVQPEEENVEKKPESEAGKIQRNEKQPYVFMFSFFMLSLVVYWFK